MIQFVAWCCQSPRSVERPMHLSSRFFANTIHSNPLDDCQSLAMLRFIYFVFFVSSLVLRGQCEEDSEDMEKWWNDSRLSIQRVSFGLGSPHHRPQNREDEWHFHPIQVASTNLIHGTDMIIKLTFILPQEHDEFEAEDFHDCIAEVRLMA